VSSDIKVVQWLPISHSCETIHSDDARLQAIDPRSAGYDDGAMAFSLSKD
jgi:hypothetical protein